MELRTARQLFFEAKRAEGITARTYQTYRDTLKPFLLYLTDEKIFQIEDVTSAHIRSYIMKHREQGVRNITLHRDFRTLKTFFFFLRAEGVIQEIYSIESSHRRLRKNWRVPLRQKKSNLYWGRLTSQPSSDCGTTP